MIYIAIIVVVLSIASYFIFKHSSKFEKPKNIYIDLLLEGVNNATPEELELIEKKVEKVEKIFNSDRFFQELMKAEMTKTNGLENAEIFYNLRVTKPFTITLFYDEGTNTGSANVELGRIRINTRFIDTCEGTIAHEYMHLLGYNHGAFGDVSTVPYTIGKIVKRLIK